MFAEIFHTTNVSGKRLMVGNNATFVAYLAQDFSDFQSRLAKCGNSPPNVNHFNFVISLPFLQI